jgi:hypothetical protein
MAKSIKFKPQQLIQQLLDAEYGEGKTQATSKGDIKYLFSETHHGCNEMQVGTWKFDSKGVHMYIRITYEEAFQFLKNGTKPAKYAPVAMEFNRILTDSNIA